MKYLFTIVLLGSVGISVASSDPYLDDDSLQTLKACVASAYVDRASYFSMPPEAYIFKEDVELVESARRKYAVACYAWSRFENSVRRRTRKNPALWCDKRFLHDVDMQRYNLNGIVYASYYNLLSVKNMLDVWGVRVPVFNN